MFFSLFYFCLINPVHTESSKKFAKGNRPPKQKPPDDSAATETVVKASRTNHLEPEGYDDEMTTHSQPGEGIP